MSEAAWEAAAFVSTAACLGRIQIIYQSLATF